MSAERLHLIRHGEVHNPDRVLYGRLPNFRLSESGAKMAQAAADYLAQQGRDVTALYVSPLQRARESAAPVAAKFGLTPIVDERVIEPTNVFEGRRMKQTLLNPLNWWHLRNPSVPSWGEPYQQVVRRMTAAMSEAWENTESGDAVIVSHQLPIWITHLALGGEQLQHDPRKRRCELSSITSFEKDADGNWVEVSYATPAATGEAIDVGAV